MSQEQDHQTQNNPSSFPPLSPNPDDNEPMVHTQPRDYATWACAEKTTLLARGEEAILQSEVSSFVPAIEGEAPADYAKRISETMNAMIRRGVSILNDQCTADAVPDGFHIGGRSFRLGPRDGVTKGEYKDFVAWFDSLDPERVKTEGLGLVPERFRRWEVGEEELQQEQDKGKKMGDQVEAEEI